MVYGNTSQVGRTNRKLNRGNIQSTADLRKLEKIQGIALSGFHIDWHALKLVYKFIMPGNCNSAIPSYYSITASSALL
jgi:hypothetical protein